MDFRVNNRSEESVKNLFRDRLFLLNFIMSNFLGPDVYSDNPRCSASQRLAEGLPPYTSRNLGTSSLSISELQSLYYYVLRNAKASLLLKPSMFNMYLKGNLSFPSLNLIDETRQFPNLFALNVHEHKSYSASHEIVKGIVLIDDPATSYMKEEDLKRFRRLSGLGDLKIDKIESLCYHHAFRGLQDEQKRLKNNVEIVLESNSDQYNGSCAVFEETRERKNEETVYGYDCVKTPNLLRKFNLMCKRRHHSDPLCKSSDERPEKVSRIDGPAVMPLITSPDMGEGVSNSAIALKGTAQGGVAGPAIGVVDVGISRVAYFFQVALPGVRKDLCEFSCEIEPDGRVILQGSTSGGKTIEKHSRVFQMKFRQLCSPGPFTISFNLPGPVDPRLFSPNFRSDGIFEAVIIKREEHANF